MFDDFFHLHHVCRAMVAALAAASMLTACGGDDAEPKPTPEPEPSVPGKPGVTLDNTTIIYVAGENTLARFVDGDSLEIAKGLPGIPDGARVVMFIDDTHSSRICVGTNKEPLQTVRTFPRNIVATDSTEMLGVLNEIMGAYPARHYGITFWSHASGWVEHAEASRAKRRSYGIDNGRRDPNSNDGPEMSIPTLAKVLAKLPHTDYLFFDACFMQCVEVAYELRNVTDWVIASPAEIPGDGAPYHIILPTMCAKTVAPDQIVKQYYDYYETGDGHKRFYGVEISAVRTDKLEALAEATRPIVGALFGGRKEPLLDDVQKYCHRDGSDYYTEYFDMASLIFNNADPDTYVAWREVCDEAVAYAGLSPMWYTALSTPHVLFIEDAETTVGMSMYTPGVRYDGDRQWNEAYHTFAWYRAAGFDQTGW